MIALERAFKETDAALTRANAERAALLARRAEFEKKHADDLATVVAEIETESE